MRSNIFSDSITGEKEGQIVASTHSLFLLMRWCVWLMGGLLNGKLVLV